MDDTQEEHGGTSMRGMSEFAQSARSAEADEPGACWNNKKARDEMTRALMLIEDKGFSLSEFTFIAWEEV